QHAVERRPRENLGRNVVEVEVQLAQHANVLACPFVDRDLQFEAHLKVAPKPGDARVDEASCLSGDLGIQWRFQGELHQRNHSVQWSGEPYVTNESLEIVEIVLHREAPLRDGWVSLEVNVRRAGVRIRTDRFVRMAERHRDTERTGEDKGLKHA